MSRLEQLSQGAQELLRRICAAHASEPFVAGKEQRLGPVNQCRAAGTLARQELLQGGWLTAVQEVSGEIFYRIPEAVLPALQQRWFSYTPAALDGSGVKLLREPGAGLAGELFRALLFTAREGLPLTAKGIIARSTMRRLNLQLSLCDETLRSLIMFFPAGDLQFPAAAVAVDLMLCLGLVQRHSKGYSLVPGQLKAWMQLPEPAMDRLLYGIVCRRYGSDRPAARHLRWLLSGRGVAPGVWVSFPALLDWMESTALVDITSRDELASAGQRWLECLAAFGWGELGSAGSGALCFRWTAGKPLPEAGGGAGLWDGLEMDMDMDMEPDSYVETASPSFIVQPDYEILVPPEVPYAVRWSLAGCAELLLSDTLWSYRLTRAQLEFALEQGLDAGQVCRWLESHALGGLPPVVRTSLAQWGRSLGRTTLSGDMLLCRSEEDADALAGHPRLQAGLSRDGPLQFRVTAPSAAALLKELAAAGMAPLRSKGPQSQPPEAVGGWFSLEAASPAERFCLPEQEPQPELLPGPLPARERPHWQPLADLPQEPLYPGLGQVPARWSREWRHYHSSTARQVMEQALAWGIGVSLTLDGQVCEFIPSRITDNPWIVAGYLLEGDSEEGASEMELTAEDWTGMKLVFPVVSRNSSSVEAAGYAMIERSTSSR
ncbi:helicase-associated domain-containing protein [Paenibacillus donghaensis]|uniref:Helicase XPB/Ssl2 N-terminal domain-containing protein n=1 Tax=Paenibacillus donghaensis TaxID=414771 RepID=A0A2Z2KD94_9BACL|nr:helicase-associated domain-containing protein [Paenibacillus donghaensis]ASA21030.1 hypothetical protein B9T62_09665 [Paenibacillus donghaensis]